eukprot:7390540-Prymnesium_polylepis.2
MASVILQRVRPRAAYGAKGVPINCALLVTCPLLPPHRPLSLLSFFRAIDALTAARRRDCTSCVHRKAAKAGSQAALRERPQFCGVPASAPEDVFQNAWLQAIGDLPLVSLT